MGKPEITWDWTRRPPNSNGLFGQRWVLRVNNDPNRANAVVATVFEITPNKEYATVLDGVRYAFPTREETMKLAEIYRRLTY